jgi:radical SAM superfamily enzyme YgiQ (UPF0313 family)
MNVLLVYPNIADHPKDISFGLASLSAVLKAAGHEVELLDATFGLSSKEISRTVRRFPPDLVGVTVATNDLEYGVDLVREIRVLTPAPVVAGGFHATIAPDDVLSRQGIDAVVIGEGESSLLELVTMVGEGEPGIGIDGVWFKRNGEVERNPLRPRLPSLGGLPRPDRELFDYARYVRANRGLATFITTRGCPYDCSYCINHTLRRLHGDRGHVRYVPVDQVIEEIADIVDRYEVREIELYDETFSTNHQRVAEFCKTYGERVGLPFSINTRASTLDADLLRCLKEAGCTRVAIGIECGDEFIRRHVLRRNETDDQIEGAFEQTRRAGLETLAYNMVGLPYETRDSIRKTIALNQRCRPDYVVPAIFNAYQGTDLHRLCEQRGWLGTRPARGYFQDSNVRHPNFKRRHLRRIRNMLGFHIFRPARPVRALVDLVDKNLLRFSEYHGLRSLLIRSGIKRLLRPRRRADAIQAGKAT